MNQSSLLQLVRSIKFANVIGVYWMTVAGGGGGEWVYESRIGNYVSEI